MKVGGQKNILTFWVQGYVFRKIAIVDLFFGQSGFKYRLLQTLGTYNAATAVKDGTVKTGTAVKNTTVNTGSAVKTGTLNTASAVKNTTTNATTAVSSSFFGVVEMARKVILRLLHLSISGCYLLLSMFP